MIALVQYLNIYKNHINIHPRTKFTDDAQDIVQKDVTQDHVEHHNAQEKMTSNTHLRQKQITR